MSRDPIGGVIRNLLDLQRLGNGVSIDVRAIIETLFDEIAAQIVRIDPTGAERERSRMLRLDRLFGDVESLVGGSFQDVRKTLMQRLVSIGVQQATWAAQHLTSTIGSVAVDIHSGRVGTGLMRSIIQNDPFEGAPLKDWVDGLEGSLTHRKLGAVRRQLQIGMAGNETLDQLVRRIRGRADGRGGFIGGVMQTTTRQAEAIARTGVNFVAVRGQLETYKANVDVIAGLEFTATLDRRTTEICMALDGEILDAKAPDPNKVPPRHWRCRSVLVPQVDWAGLGITPPAEGKRASADGPVPSSVKYEEWLRTQPPEVQDEILGPTRAKLFREGKLSLRDLITSDQQVVTVTEIEKRTADPTGPISKQKLAAIVAAEERRIAAEPIEYATAFSPTTGEVVLHKTTGQRSQVQFTPEEAALTKDTVFTHNHPSSSSFSTADIGFSIANDIAEMRAVGTRYSYRLVRPPDGWEPIGEVDRRWRKAEEEVWDQMRALLRAGEMTNAEASIQHNHEVWKRVFRGTATRYIRTKREP